MNGSERWRLGAWIVSVWLVGAAWCPAADQPAGLARQQRDQEQARVMAEELVSSVLDVQLRQLAENQLDHLPIYAEIRGMRANLREVVDRAMPGIATLLVAADQAAPDERAARLGEARGRIREVLQTLLAEQQRLAKRMRLAKLSARLRQLIDLEGGVQRSLRSLAGEAPRERERAILAALEDQRDVATAAAQFQLALEEVATWEGSVGATAAQGLRLVKTLQLEAEAGRAETSLSAGQLLEAERAVAALLQGWQALLAVLEQTQGLVGSDRESLIQAVAALMQRQQALREETEVADSQDPAVTERLARQQHDLQTELGSLQQALKEFANTESLVEQAQAAAVAAETKLFEGAIPEASQQQGQVLAALAEIQQRLESAGSQHSTKTAEDLAREVGQLATLDAALDQIRPLQEQVVAQAEAQPAVARKQEEAVATQLAAANEAAHFGAALEARLADAQDRVRTAVESLGATAAPATGAERRARAQEARRAIDLAAAEVKQALADRRREELAVAVGELARAAEALERAAATEQEISRLAHEAAQASGLTNERAADLSAEQNKVNQIASDIAEGVAATSGATRELLEQTRTTREAVQQTLATWPQVPAEQRSASAAGVADSTRQTASGLETAAKSLRERSGKLASELARFAAEHRAPATAARREIERSLATEEAREPLERQIAPLRAALEQTEAAQRDQWRASGRPAVAEQLTLLRTVQDALRRQHAAEQAADDYVRGRSPTPVAASQAAEQVADLLRGATAAAPPAVRSDLQLAERAARDGARQLVVGSPQAGQQARLRTRELLAGLANRLRQGAEAATKSPPRNVDREAQSRVSVQTTAARDTLRNLDPAATAALEQARQQSDTAFAALTAATPSPEAQQAQNQSQRQLDQAHQEISRALNAVLADRARSVAAAAQQTAALAEQSLKVDAGAAVALRQAADAAPAPTPEANPADTARDAAGELKRGLERAAANLAAREQDLQRDQEVAEKMARLATEQQAARDQIVQQSARLAELAQRAKNQETPRLATTEELAAAQALTTAAEQFAEAQRETGEGAAEISGQDEVANQPIRRGLETASQLGQQLNAPPPEAEAPATEPAANQDAAKSADSPQSGKSGPGKSNPQQPAENPGENTAGGQQPSPGSDSEKSTPGGEQELGTNFVPRSPEETARRIAGKEALAEAEKALANKPPQPSDAMAGDAAKPSQAESTAENAESPEGEASEAKQSRSARKGEASKGADEAGQNEKLDPSRLEQETGTRERDSRSGPAGNTLAPEARRFRNDPWFLQLPPSLQQAIQARSRRAPPKGYEERLQRYFQNSD